MANLVDGREPDGGDGVEGIQNVGLRARVGWPFLAGACLSMSPPFAGQHLR